MEICSANLWASDSFMSLRTGGREKRSDMDDSSRRYLAPIRLAHRRTIFFRTVSYPDFPLH